MRTDHDIDKTFLKIFNSLFLLGRSPESRHKIDSYGEVTHALGKSIVVLLRKNRSRHQYRHLLSILYRFERSADRNLRFSESDVAADKPVHDNRGLHIFFGVFNCSKLIFCLLIGKRIFEFLLPDRILTKLIALGLLPLCIEFDKVLRNFFYGCFYLTLGMCPFKRSEFIELWLVAVLGISAGSILLNNTEAGRENIKISSAAVLNFNVVSDDVVSLNLLDTSVDSESVFFMNNVVANLKVSEIGNFFSGIFGFFLLSLFNVLGENITLCDNRKLNVGILKTFKYPSVVSHYLAGT